LMGQASVFHEVVELGPGSPGAAHSGGEGRAMRRSRPRQRRRSRPRQPGLSFVFRFWF
jgi:hypothetical protein